jgi:hypothetical protein
MMLTLPFLESGRLAGFLFESLFTGIQSGRHTFNVLLEEAAKASSDPK